MPNIGELDARGIRHLIAGDHPIIVEIGCNDGEDTLKFLAEFPDCRIYCFEPDPRPIRRFRERINDPRVELAECAIGADDDYRDWYASHGVVPNQPERFPESVQTDWDLSGSLLRPTGHYVMSPWVTFRKNDQVPCRRLDTWLDGKPEITAIDFIWCDVQGAEGEVIAGGRNTLAIATWFYTEFNDRPNAGPMAELYENQPRLESLCALMPDFELQPQRYSNNVLFRNKHR